MFSVFNHNKKISFLLPLLVVLLAGCFKKYEEDFLFRDAMVEFDAATWESKAPGKNYPILGPLEKGSGMARFKVNLLGGHQPVAQTIRYKVVAGETTAEEGLHYELADGGVMEIPANSSTGEVAINILDFPPGSGAVNLVLELEGNETIKVSENYKQIGIAISLVGKPSTLYPLHTQIGEGSYYNTIAIDIMQPGLSADFLNRWETMRANLFAFSTGGRTPYGLQVRFGDNNQARVTFVYTTTASLAFSYAYASWIYELQLDDQGRGHFVFVNSVDANGTNLRAAGVMAPILENWLEQYEFKVDWVDEAVSTPRPGAQLGGLFRTDDPSSFVFGELTNIGFESNTPRPMPTSPHVYTLFDNNGNLYSSVLIDPEDAEQSQKFKDLWTAGKNHIINTSAGRQLHQFLLVFDTQFNDLILVMAYANATSTSKFIGQTRYWLRMSHEGEMTFDYVHQNANAGVTSPPQLFDDYLHAKKFKVTRHGNKLRFTDTTDPDSWFVGSLGDLPISANSFSWWF